MIKAVFLDRDGVINVDKHYLYKISDFEFVDGIFDALLHCQALGYRLIIVSNQSGISRGYYREQDYHSLNRWMLDKFTARGINILASYYCPHVDKDACHCRKPSPGMLLQARDEHQIDLSKSWMIGDKIRDIIAAHRAGIKQTILFTEQLPDEPMVHTQFIAHSLRQIVALVT